jgi:predicted transcriptional regulator
LLALAKLVELRRRSLGLTPDELSRQASVPQAEILCLEAGVAGPPVKEHLSAIARILRLREGPLLDLVADNPDPTDRVRQAAEQFVARTAHSEMPTSNETEAVEEFVRVLELA